MKSLYLIFGMFLILASGCSTTPPTQQIVTMLLGSGFKEITATTPDQLAQLKALPPGKITATTRGGKTRYAFPDAAHNKLYVGNADQYQSYVQTYQDVQMSKGMARAGLVMEDEISVSLGAFGIYGD